MIPGSEDCRSGWDSWTGDAPKCTQEWDNAGCSHERRKPDLKRFLVYAATNFGHVNAFESCITDHNVDLPVDVHNVSLLSQC